MSDLIAITYPDEATARQVREKLIDLTRGHSVELEDLVIVTCNESGKVKLHQAVNLAGAGAAGGALWGALIGMLFFAPLLGAAIGGAAGAVGGALTDVGIDDTFLRELGQHLTPGSAAVIVLVRKMTPDKVLQQISQFGGKILQSSLSTEAEQHLQTALDNGIQPATQAKHL